MKHNNALIAFFMAAALLTMPYAVSAAQSSITTELRFAVSVNDEVTVTIYVGEGAADVTTEGGAVHTDNILFTSTTGTDTLINATLVAGSAQDATHAILHFENTGNANVGLNISINETVETQVDACWDVFYLNGTYTEATPRDLNTTSIYLVPVFTPSSVLDVWLLASTTACSGSTNGEVLLNITATTV